MALRMTKEDFLCRLNDRIAGRYGDPISQGWLNDLVKDGLLTALSRGANRGRSPTYFATACHYRRALHIKRLHSQGVRSRDAILIQLFVHRHGISGALAREALRREFAHVIKLLNRQLMSSHFDGPISDTPGPKRTEVVSRQMGQLEERFVDRGLELPTMLYLQLVKSARSPTYEDQYPFAGALLEADGHFSPTIELALNSSPEALETARNLLSEINRLFLRPTFGGAILATPEVAATLLVLVQIMLAGGFTLEQLSATLASAPGFEDLLHGWSAAAHREL